MTGRARAFLLAHLVPVAAVLVGFVATSMAAGANDAVPEGQVPQTSVPCDAGVTVVRGSDMTHLDDGGSRWNHVARLPMPVNALGYRSAGRLFYGVSGSRIVTVTPAGHLTVRGTAPHGTADGYAGAISGSRWYVRSGGDLAMLSVDPSSPDYLHVLRRVPVLVPGVLGDFDVDPATGLLYGVAAPGLGHGTVVRIDPATGHVTALARPSNLPGLGSYGGAAIRHGVLEVILNSTGTLYRIPLDDPDHVTSQRPAGTAGTLGDLDAAACPSVTVPPPPSSPVPTPTPTHTRTPPPPASPSPSRSPAAGLTPTTAPPSPGTPPSAAPVLPVPPPPSTVPSTGPTRVAPPVPVPRAFRTRPALPRKAWTPHRSLPLTMSVAILMVIPTAAGAARATGRTLRHRR